MCLFISKPHILFLFFSKHQLSSGSPSGEKREKKEKDKDKKDKNDKDKHDKDKHDHHHKHGEHNEPSRERTAVAVDPKQLVAV